MTARADGATSAARRPPHGLPGLDLRFSQLLDVPGRGADAGRTRGWHYLDNGPELARRGHAVVGTVLAVHGNPTWSYLWRDLVAAATAEAAEGRPAWRVVAVDQLEMGFSERTDVVRTLRQRVSDLGAFTESLGLDGPVVTLGHDWGGVVSLGWAVAHPGATARVALLNTAVHHPDGVLIPAPLRLARARPVLSAATTRTSAFLDTTLALARPPLADEVRAAYRAPYLDASRRGGIGAFVADIPAGDGHESTPALDEIAESVRGLDVPALLLWGPRDPIFGDRYLDDLLERLPQAQVHRFEGAGHLLAEDAPCAAAVLAWLAEERGTGRRATASHAAAGDQAAGDQADDDGADGAPAFVPFWQRLDDRRDDAGVAVIDMAPPGGGPPRHVTWRHLAARVQHLAIGLHAAGVRRGDRVQLLVRPGPTLTATVYACLRIGAVVVVADAGLGIQGLSRAVTGAWPDHLVGEARGLAAATALRWPGTRIAATTLRPAAARALGVTHTVPDLMSAGREAERRGTSLPAPPGPADEAAVLFTSGSTGPAKGVVYTHARLAAVRDVICDHFAIGPETGLVTGFAPFALLGPALGTRSATPDMDVSAPRTLTARAVAAAVAESGARMVFLSPAAILNVAATAGDLDAADHAALAGVRTVLSTGAPISEALLGSVARLVPNARAHTPYGMTECLLVTDVDLDGIREAAAAPDAGVCVGRPIGSIEVLVSALDADGAATGEPSRSPGVLGEIVISAPHLKERYDRLWLTDRAATRAVPASGRWHRTGDVGHLDADGRLWVEGRLAHVLVTAAGVVAPVGPEQEIERVPGVRRAAVVGVGPRGTQQAVAVVETVPDAPRAGLASAEETAQVRGSTSLPLAAVLVVTQLPTDVRHNSKIERVRLGAWAQDVLAGARAGAP